MEQREQLGALRHVERAAIGAEPEARDEGPGARLVAARRRQQQGEQRRLLGHAIGEPRGRDPVAEPQRVVDLEGLASAFEQVRRGARVGAKQV